MPDEMTATHERSALAYEIAQVDQRVLDLFGVSEPLIRFLDLLVAATRLLLDDQDARPWPDRLADLESLVEVEAVTPEQIATIVGYFEQLREKELDRWARRLQTKQGRTFLRRLIGAAAYDRLAKATRSDGAVLIIGLRRGLRALLPVALALDDCIALLSPQQIAAVPGFRAVEHTMLTVGYQLDRQLDRLLGMDVPLDKVAVRDEEQTAINVDVSALALEMRKLVSVESDAKLTELSEALARKVRGARQALEFSDDGVSQAANSLLEFVDRLLRGAFDDQFVLAWIEKNYAHIGGLTYEDQPRRLRPTKRGQALCFAHAGKDQEQLSTLHLLAAGGISEARKQLQALKHADEGTPEERELFDKLMPAVEGFFVFAIRSSWSSLSDERLEELRARL